MTEIPIRVTAPPASPQSEPELITLCYRGTPAGLFAAMVVLQQHGYQILNVQAKDAIIATTMARVPEELGGAS